MGPYIPTIERFLHNTISRPPTTDLTIRDIVERLRGEEGFAGSYESVRNYIRHQTCNDQSAWEWAYDLIVRLPKPRALDFIRLLSRGGLLVFTAALLRPFVHKAFVRKYRNKFNSSGAEAVFAPHTKSNRKIDNEELRSAVFSLLHEPPANHGINRTSWTMPLLSLEEQRQAGRCGRRQEEADEQKSNCNHPAIMF